ncbi:sulfite dehydrogenase (cytochrome) subunit SorA apoprotein [Maribacter sedimenticola]|uniref:Sulfite dehydrogenase (Cytochrome) subunit SorA apoprotein n=1 Tax=Maribacter sedimenticola TaxID=228956 RepID=A0ABY1SHR8_9FLAO|nr:sulfite oxidase [Maribacter sedimenticola]SNR48249.1 sulfite dehydrogenase (cytochrome) subunit SorA apoprotein [Maribacter sedimenticola]
MKRRSFVTKSSLAGLSSVLGIDIVYGALMPSGYTPLAYQDVNPFTLFKKDEAMVVLNDRPWNMEAQAHLLNDPVTPNKYMFIRNNGLIPETIDEKTWTLTINGESVKAYKTYTLQDLKTKFKHYTYQLTLECGGNGRSEFDPPAKGNQWTIGAVSCANWTGIRLKDLLTDVGLKDDAVYIGYHAADQHLSKNPNKEPISRGVPIAKAMQDETLIAFAMNGEPIPKVHGFPLRLVCGGWPASTSGKWLTGISVRNKVHDGEKMGGSSYRVPCETVAPGETVTDDQMCIIESMPVKSLITYPKSGALLTEGKMLKINGHAWAGELQVAKMEYSIDFGSSWNTANLDTPTNRLAWQSFSARVSFPKKGYYEIWARATDENGTKQPMVLPGWNPKGYLNNACHRIAVKVV